MLESLINTEELPIVRGKYRQNAPLGETSWFRTGGTAEILFKPFDTDDLASFLYSCPKHIPITVVGVMSNIIVRDGGVKGVVIKLGREFANIKVKSKEELYAGASSLDINVANMAEQLGIGGMEFLAGIPGTIGGALRMNAGAYGGEIKDILLCAKAVDRQGQIHELTPDNMGMSYRHTTTPDDYIFTEAILHGAPENNEIIQKKIAQIKKRRSTSQPIKSRTGGSTFANPSDDELIAAGLELGTKTWQLIDKAGCRGLKIGGAQMSELHCNFMINTGNATATSLETLGEEVKKRVFEDSGITLRWEIKRIGEYCKKS